MSGLGFSTSTTGGAFAGEELANSVIAPLVAQSAILAAAQDAGRLLYSSGTPLRLPHLDTMPTGTSSWVAEGTAIPEIVPATSNITLLPSTLRGLKAIIRVSNELVRHDLARGLDMVGQQLVKRLTLDTDAAMINGPGTGGQITGLLNASGIQTINAAAQISLDLLHNTLGAALAANCTPSCWVMAPRTLVEIRRLKDTTNAPIVIADQERPTVPNGFSEQTPSAINQSHSVPRPILLGLPVYLSTAVPINQGTSPATKSSVLLIDQNQIAVAVDKEFNVDILREVYAATDEVGIRVTGRVDLGVLNPQAVVALTGILVTP